MNQPQKRLRVPEPPVRTKARIVDVVVDGDGDGRSRAVAGSLSPAEGTVRVSARGPVQLVSEQPVRTVAVAVNDHVNEESRGFRLCVHVRAFVLAFAVLAFGCDWSLQRMMDQSRCDADEQTSFFANGTCNQVPPAGTLPFEPAPRQERETLAVSTAPSRDLVTRGRGRFEIFCAPCHGVLGDGQSEVAENMVFRRPPSLLDDRTRKMSDEYVQRVITHGFGLMPSYGRVLSGSDARAVVAYMRVLWLSQNVLLSELPPAVRKEAAPWLR